MKQCPAGTVEQLGLLLSSLPGHLEHLTLGCESAKLFGQHLLKHLGCLSQLKSLQLMNVHPAHVPYGLTRLSRLRVLNSRNLTQSSGRRAK